MSDAPKGYWIAHATVFDPGPYEDYKAGIIEPFKEYGAKFLVRGGEATVLEGSFKDRHIVIEFPSVQAALDCFHSPGYQAAKAKREGASENDVIVVAGVS